MANFDQNITIDLKVKTDTFTSKLGTAAAELKTFKEGIEGLDSDLDNAAKSLTNFSNKSDKNITPNMDMDTLREQRAALTDMADSLDVISEKKEEAADENRKLSKRNKEGEKSAYGEAKAFNKLSTEGDSLAKVKRDAANANKMLTKRNKEGTKSSFKETKGWKKLKEAGWELNEAMEALNLREKEMSKSTDKNSSTFRKLSRSIDKTGDSMRAANKVGDLFEDGLGSLSVNLGAFTIALRNFLTQVPILLGALGSLGSAAIGVAGAFITAGTAIGSAIGAGALAMARDLDEQYQEIEGTGEALQVMLEGLKDTFSQAVAPLTENPEVIGMFRQFIVGLAEDISLVADTFDKLMTAQDSWKDGVLGISGVMDTLGAKLEEPFRDFVASLSFMFLNLQDEFIDITVGLVKALEGLTIFTTKFTDGITENTRVLDQFIAGLKEVAFVGSTIFDGLAPIFLAFSSAMESVAGAINSMNSEFISSIVTFGIIIAAINKFGGTVSSIVGIIPNLIFGLKASNGSMLAMVESMAKFTKDHPTIFGGFTSLAEAAENFSGEMSILSARTHVTDKTFGVLDSTAAELLKTTLLTTESMDEFEEQLIESALASELGEKKVSALNKELAAMGLNSRIAADGLDEINKSSVDPNVDVAKKKGLKNVGAGAVGGGIIGGGLRKAVSKLVSPLTKLGKLLKSGTALFMALKAALLILATGGIFVGIIGNLDSVISLLSKLTTSLGRLFKWMGSEILDIFIDTWNALYDIFVGVFMVVKPFIDLFKALTGPVDDSNSSLSELAAGFEYLLDLVGAVFAAVGGAIRIIGTAIGIILTSVFGGLLAAIASLVNYLGNKLAPALNYIGEIFDSNKEGIIEFISLMENLPEAIKDDINESVLLFQDGFNRIIDSFNELIKKLNKSPFINFETIDNVDFGIEGEEGARVSREELAANADEYMDGFAGNRDKTITYNEDNSTNIDQTIDADPEDQAQLSRVVSDAIAEANSFNRRRQGGQ